MDPVAPALAARVVVVDDDLAVRQSLKFVLEVVGYRVTVCPAAQLEHTDLENASCMIVDHELTPVSGLDILIDLRSRGRLTPAVLMSVGLALNQMQLARDHDITVVRKPIVDDVLFTAVEDAVAALQ